VQVWESVKEVRSRVGPDSTQWVWREAVSEESDRPLLFGHGRTVAAVWTWGTTAILPSGWSDWRGQSLPPEDRNPELRHGGAPGQGIRTDSQGTFGPRFRYVEQIIEKDAPIFVLGNATRTDPSLYGDEEDEEYDDEAGDASSGEGTFGGGDGESWGPEPNRLGLLPTPDAVTAADMAQASWTIGTVKGQPFLISTEHPEAVTAEQELGAKGGMIMGGLFAALALFLAWARLAA
jgi:hypothetical protein